MSSLPYIVAHLSPDLDVRHGNLLVCFTMASSPALANHIHPQSYPHSHAHSHPNPNTLSHLYSNAHTHPNADLHAHTDPHSNALPYTHTYPNLYFHSYLDTNTSVHLSDHTCSLMAQRVGLTSLPPTGCSPAAGDISACI